MYAALRREADTRCDGRSRGQVMADTLVERVTGRDAAVPTPIAVNLVLSDETLLGGDSAPADIGGYGPIPAAVARAMVAGALADRRSRATLRRLYAHPRSGALVAMESRARLFPRGLAAFIELRDQRCRTPYCDAPIRHRDHARPWAAGGPTTADNGLGSCERCNYAKEASGWRVTTSTDENHTHTAEFTTPTGKTYRSVAPPRAPTIAFSDVEVRIGVATRKACRLGRPPASALVGEALEVDDFAAIYADPIAPIEVRAQASADEIEVGRRLRPLQFVDVRQLGHPGIRRSTASARADRSAGPPTRVQTGTAPREKASVHRTHRHR